ncbi:hypothetical protein WJX82_011336 [Trebouxia sp. C0006]
MPAVRMFGRKWRVSSDFLPLFAGVGLLFHSAWVIFIIVWPFGITNVHKCNNFKAGRQFQAAVCLFFGLYVLSFVQELLITVIGLRGTPLETSKRRAMKPVLYTQLLNWVGQLGVVSYGSYVTHTYSTAIVISYCSDASVVMLKVLVYSSWAMIAFNWGRLLVVYNLFPDYERVDSWAKRIRFYTWYSRSKNVITHLEKHQHRPLGRLAELYSRLLHGADMSPSDEFVSIILLSAAQRKSRQEHIRRALNKYRRETSAAQQEADKPHKETNGKAPPPPPSNDPSRHPSQSHGPHARKSHSRRSSHSRPQTQSESEFQNQHVDCNGEAHSTDLEHAGEASSVHGGSRSPAKSSRQPASAKKADTQDLKDMEEGTHGTDNQTELKMNGEHDPGMQHARMSSRRKLNQDEFFRKDFMLAPSSYACEYEPDIAPDKLADIYTGYKERVSQPEVTEAARFAKYAIAAYGAAGFQYLHQTSKVKNTYNLLKNRGKSAYKANKLMSSKIQSLEQHLDYEAIIQIAEIDDQDLLYLNFDNQALGDLPYMLALDRPTKSVVLSIRGTVSVADLATDMLADPEPMEEWLPDTMTEEEESCIEQGPRRAHAGIMAAATAIWKDLRVHRILPALLNVSSDSDDEDNPEYDIGAGEHNGFDEAYGSDDDPAPMPEDQRLPAPHEQPRAHHKKEPIPPADDGTHGHSPSRRHADDDTNDPQTREVRRQGEHVERQGSMNPITLVGKGLHAGVSSLQEVPQQAIGHMMGGVSGSHRSQRRLAAQATAEAAGSSPGRAAGHSPHRQASAKSPQRRRRQHAAATKRNQNAAAAAADDAPETQGTERQMGSHHPESNGSADVHPQDQPSDSSGLRGWDKERHVSQGNGPRDVTSQGAANAPGDDAVSQAGARDPKKSAGAQESGNEEEEGAEQSKDSATRNDYAADIIKRGLNKEGWKLVITGHSLGAGAAALIALKLKDRFPEVKCWAFCPPGGLLTPNMAHSMKPFCTSVVVNKDAIPRMSLKNLNRFMEGKLMALACSRLNAFQIFWGSYGKVNRRHFFDKEIFRPISEMPEEAREMLERFQECTLTDVSAQDMVPPGRVMYLRRFKASPNACPIKQEEHRQRARATKHLHKPNTSNLRRRLSASSGDSSGNYYRQAGLQKPKGPLQGVESGPASGWASRRRKKKTLHESLRNPKDLFWDAVWIEPEDIIREGLLVSPKMTEDHYTISLLTSLKAVSERLASQEGKSGKESTQGSTQVTAADKKDNLDGHGQGHKSKNHSGGVKEAALGGVFDLV